MTDKPKMYFFDMDHTLIDNDCDVSWKQFLVQEKLAPQDALKTADKFFEDYVRGELDSDEFMKFQLQEFIGRTPDEMLEIAEHHFESMVKCKIYSSAEALVRRITATGKPAALLTATNTIIAAPLARYLGLDLLGTTLEMKSGVFTGNISEPYCVGTGKIDIAAEFCRENNCTLAEAAYYGDSINDRFILASVGFPFAVNPASELARIAEENEWPILNFSK